MVVELDTTDPKNRSTERYLGRIIVEIGKFDDVAVFVLYVLFIVGHIHNIGREMVIWKDRTTLLLSH